MYSDEAFYFQACKHNTTGDHCERCASGFYGIVKGFPDDCKPCACPLRIASNKYVKLYKSKQCLSHEIYKVYSKNSWEKNVFIIMNDIEF